MRRGQGEGAGWSSWRWHRRPGAIRRRRPHSPRLFSRHQSDMEDATSTPVASQWSPTTGGNGGMGGTGGRMGISYSRSRGGGNINAKAQQRRLGSLWCFLRQQDLLLRITEMGMAMHVPMPLADVGESIAVGNGSSDLFRIFFMSSWDDTNSNIMFSASGNKKAEVLGDSNVGMVTSFSNTDSQIQLALSSWTCLAWTTTCSCSRTPPTAESTPSVAAPLTRRASLGRERRTRINKRLRRLQDLIPYMDKVSRTEYTRRRNLRANISAKGLL